VTSAELLQLQHVAQILLVVNYDKGSRPDDSRGRSLCYYVLRILHEKWKPVDNLIKDYIAIPKTNGYQVSCSL
jgi:GTP diphosphokinase / guanosine-3',5'-bis(diphosphate) 3'-diphosphatase